MFCKECKEFFSVTDIQVESEVVCPNCRTAQLAERKFLICQCPVCNQNLEVESWMQGEQVQCPSCQQTITLKQVDTTILKSAQAPTTETQQAPPVPRFHTASTGKNAHEALKPAPTSAVAGSQMPHLTFRTQAPAKQQTVLGTAEEATTENRTNSVAPVDESLIAAGKSLADQLSETQISLQEEPSPQDSLLFLKKHKSLVVKISIGVVAFLILLTIIIAIFSFCDPLKEQFIRMASYVRNDQKEEIEKLLKRNKAEKRKLLVKVVLSEALKAKKCEVVNLLLEKGYICPNEYYGNYSMLDLAAHKEYDWLFKLLIRNKANLNLPLKDGTRLLQQALKNKDINRIEELLENGADPNISDQLGTPLIFETISNPDILQLFVEHKANLNCRDWMQNTPLHAALLAGNLESASYLLSHKVSATALNNHHDTALILFMRLDIEKKSSFLKSLLAIPCNPNNVNLNQESALSLAIQQEQFELIIPLLKAGVIPPDDLLDQIPEKNKFADDIKVALKHFKKMPVTERTLEKSPEKEIMPPYGNQKILLRFSYLLFWFFWVACGLLSLRFFPQEKDSWRNKTANLITLFTGPLMPLAILIQKLYHFVHPWINKLLSPSEQEKADQLRFFNADGEENTMASSPEQVHALNLCRNILTQALSCRCLGVLFSPTGANYQIILKQEKQDLQVMQFGMPVGRNILIFLKNLAGLDVYEDATPQNGIFGIRKGHSRRRVLISTIGMGVQGERALLTFKQPQRELRSFHQLELSATGKAAIDAILTKQNGLIIVTGKPGNGRRTFISLLLEEFAEKLGCSVWIGVGNEPEGSNAVPRLNAKLSAKVTPERLLRALPDCRAAAITLERNDTATIRYAFHLAETKPIILLMEQPTTEKAIKLCLNAGIIETQILESLTLVVTPLMLHKLCDCAVYAELPAENQEDFRRLNLPVNHIRAKNGCVQCAQSGEDRPIVIYGTDIPGADWLKCCKTGGNRMNLLRITACCLAAKGSVTLNEINNVLPTIEDEKNA